MKKRRRKSCNLFACLLAWFVVGAAAADASATESVLALVTQEVVDDRGEAVDFWWSGKAPQWTATDEKLAESMAGEGINVAEPSDITSLSRIYRQPDPSPTNAIAMATVFGERQVLVGTVRYEPTSLEPVGLVGWSARADLLLVRVGAARRDAVVVERSAWAPSTSEAVAAVRERVTESIARIVAGQLRTKVGPVGVDGDEPVIGVSATTRRALDAVRARLGTLAGVEATRVAWAAEGIVALEVNPGKTDREESIRKFANLLTTEQPEGFEVEPVDSPLPGVLMFRVEEANP